MDTLNPSLEEAKANTMNGNPNTFISLGTVANKGGVETFSESVVSRKHQSHCGLVEAYLQNIQASLFFQEKTMDGSFAFFIDFYNSRAKWMMFWFRLFGVLAIVLSAFLPFLAAYEQQIVGGTMIVALVVVIIANATGLSAFFRWDVGWQGYINTRNALLQLRSRWEAEIAQATLMTDCEKGLEHAQTVTEAFIFHVNRLVDEEAKGYFSVQRIPESQGGAAEHLSSSLPSSVGRANGKPAIK